jgi:hypothetical protein
MENQTPIPPTLTVTDMASLVTIIDVACSRGAFRANEMSSIGPIFDRLKTFVDHSNAMSETDPDSGTANQGESNA